MSRLMQQLGFPNPWVAFTPSLLNPVGIASSTVLDALYIELGRKIVQVFLVVELHASVPANPMSFGFGFPFPPRVQTDPTQTLIPFVPGSISGLNGFWSGSQGETVITLSATENDGLSQLGPVYSQWWQFFKV